MRPIQRRPLPAENAKRRGFADINRDGQGVIKKLVELLVWNDPELDYKPSDIIFNGYAYMAFDRMVQMGADFQHFLSDQMEQTGTCLAIANLCKQAGEASTENSVFSLLGGDPMHVDVLLQQFYWTGAITEENDMQQLNIGFEVCQRNYSGFDPHKLTPDQDSSAYCMVMKEGPVLWLSMVARYNNFSRAMWAAFGRSKFYHLFVQRLLRWAARETKRTKDGIALGGKARKILCSMFPDLKQIKNPLSEKASARVLEEGGSVLSEPSKVTTENVQLLLEG